MCAIWNEIVLSDKAFPQTELLEESKAYIFFLSQTYCAVAVEEDKVRGFSVLHPNGIGHCQENANASYAVEKSQRGRHIGKILVQDSLGTAKRLGFHNLQLNAVVASNTSAIHLYEELGFIGLGTLREGYKHNDGTYEDLKLFYYHL
ncbi:MAG: GNAT family N-acetyltransferase [Sphaerochaetaceae bacterium]